MADIDMSDYEQQGLLHDMFVRQAIKTPSRVAVVTAFDRQMTFEELNEATDHVASWLRLKGVRPDTVVGIYMERNLEYVVAYIAILKAGGAYMPMDVSYPRPLLDDILADAQPTAVLTAQSLVENIPGAANVLVCSAGWLERVRQEVQAEEGSLPDPPQLTLDNLAYTVYSSGTTGKPKGIQCPHRGAVFSYHHRHLAYPYVDGDREACNVFFVWEMLRPLLQGVTMYIIPDNTIYDPPLLCQFLHKHQITRMLFTPSLLEAVLEADNVDVAALLTSMRTVVFCGEVVTVGLLGRCLKTLPRVQFVNLYSISESHDVACTDLTQWYLEQQARGTLESTKFCPVGKLLPMVQVVILNDDLEPQPVGVSGEIYIGGPSLARGYLNRPDLNSTRFIARPPLGAPQTESGRLYKAGDWGYMLSDGSLEICGRCDSMVKIRGYSIETQAVEAALLQLPMVSSGVIVAMGEEGEDRYLVAYIVPDGKTTKKEVRACLKKCLPFYMIPSYFMFLNSIPILASSGKLNKKALPAVERGQAAVAVEGQPTTETERLLAPIWAQIHGLTAVDVHETFFDLGGHSLSATRLLAKVKDVFGVEVSVRDLFDHATVAAMAAFLDGQRGRNDQGALQRMPPLDLKQEVEVHDATVASLDIQLRAFWRSVTQYRSKWSTGRVMLTGASGFLGSFLLRDLLLQTQTHVFCLVRDIPDKEGLKRLRQTLAEYGILAEAPSEGSETQKRTEHCFQHRVTVVKGDVGLVNLGLSDDDYAYLTTEIDFVIHAAAYVNLIYPYQALHSANVMGTQNILRFAQSSKIKPVHYISTDAVFPAGREGCSETEDMTRCGGELRDGYGQSKWVAEQLVLRSIERGFPAIVYRLGNLSGDSRGAFWNPQDFNLLMIKGCIVSGHAPDVRWNVEMTPVDFVSDVIVTLTQNMALNLGKVFHVINRKPMKCRWLWEWLTAHGYPVKIVTFDKWLAELTAVGSELKDGGLLQRLVDGMIRDETFFSCVSTYKQDNLEKVLEVHNKTYPEISHQLLLTYVQNLARRRIIPSVRRNTLLEKKLEGVVAIVTGASSGMGAAIAKCLAKEGALVAMAARREDRMEEVKSSIQREGGVAIAVKCDVTDRDQVTELVRHTEATLGPVDILINNAGVMYYTLMKNLKEDEWNKQIDINCKGVVNCIGGVLDGMLKRGRGHIVNMSSDAGRRGFAGLAVYSGTKFFVEGLSQGMRVELAGTGLKVTCVQPGDVRTELLTHNTDSEAKDQFDGSSTTHILEPEDVARAVLFAVTQPQYCSVNEILIEPREAPI